MQVEERRRQILAAVHARGVISLREAAEVAGTSEVTARRDLRLLADRGLVRRTHGGAASPQPLSREPSYLEKAAQGAQQKEAIARVAAAMVVDAEAIALGAGTTTLALARLLRDRSDLTVLTTSLLVCEALMQSDGVEVLVSGGTMRTATHALVGPIAVQSLAGLFVTTLFVSGNGLTAARGLSTPDVLAAAVDQRLADCAARIVVLADHSKIGVEAVSQTIPCARIDCVVTDDSADDRELQRLRAEGIEVVVARTAACAPAEQGSPP